MAFSILGDKTVEPTDDQLFEVLRDVFPLWENIIQYVDEKHGPIEAVWKFTGEKWGCYTHWWITETSGDGPFSEIYSSASNSAIGFWNDFGVGQRYGYIAEVPEPATLLVLGLGGLAFRAKRRR